MGRPDPDSIREEEQDAWSGLCTDSCPDHVGKELQGSLLTQRPRGPRRPQDQRHR